MNALKRSLGNWWVITLAAAALLALGLALALPIVVGFLRPWWARLLLVSVVAVAWAILAVLRLRRARRASEAISAELQLARAGDAEAGDLARRMSEALGRLKAATGGRRDYLYSRPWYVIIGPPGAGKTTALLNSGLRFPYADSALKGVGGTRDVDFWFADEAVLVDTAGRYASQDSQTEADARGWESFLKLLRRHRPLQPVNGVIVAIALDELMRADAATLDAHAATVRRRLAELRRALEVAAPVYLLLTKADLIAGFTEFFADLDVEGRRAVFGATEPWTGEAADMVRLTRAFDEMAQAVADRTSKRLQEEPDVERRGLILGFPPQLQALRSRLLRFLEGAFTAEPVDPPPLRGFYFTSGVQQGAPLDRILASVASVFQQPRAPQEGRGRAYFLNRLLKDVIFAEPGLVQAHPKVRARRRLQLTMGLAGVAGACALLIGLWAMSFIGNRNLQTAQLRAAQSVQRQVRDSGLDLVEVRESDPDLEQSLSVLRALRELPMGYAERRGEGVPLALRFGLFQDGAARRADLAYEEGLRRIMLPRVLLRLERYLQDHRDEPLDVYEPLKTYLMLGGHGPLDRKAARAWIMADWADELFPGADREGVRKELAQHLDALLADEDLSAAWPGRTAPLDGALIASARDGVQTLSPAERAYALLRQRAAAGEPWSARAVLSAGQAQAFADREAVLTLQAPYVFTRAGYERVYQPGLQTVQGDLKKELWVLGQDADTLGVREQVASVRAGMADLYAREYIGAWQRVIDAMQPADYFNDRAAYGAFTGEPSPFKLLLLEVRRNTSFEGGLATAAGRALKGPLASPAGRLARDAALGRAAPDAGALIAAHFKPVHDYVGDGKSPAAVDALVAAVREAGTARTAASLAGGGPAGDAVQAQLNVATAAVASAASRAPAALQPFVTAAAQGGRTAAVAAAQGAVTDAYEREIAGACRSVTQDRYPFYGAAQNDAAAADMLRLFGLNGQIDSFTQRRLLPLLDTGGPVWRWRGDDPVAARLDPTSAEQLHRAVEIRDLLAGGLPLKVEAAGFGGKVTAAELSAGGATQRFEPSDARARPLMWSLSGGLPEARLVLLGPAGEVARFEAQGPWAPFRLMDQARRENAGPHAIRATFGEGAAAATFRIVLPGDRNPFGRGGLWSFRCPGAL